MHQSAGSGVSPSLIPKEYGNPQGPLVQANSTENSSLAQDACPGVHSFCRPCLYDDENTTQGNLVAYTTAPGRFLVLSWIKSSAGAKENYVPGRTPVSNHSFRGEWHLPFSFLPYTRLLLLFIIFKVPI